MDATDAPVVLTNGGYPLLVAFVDAPLAVAGWHLLQVRRVHEGGSDHGIVVQFLRLRRKLETDPRVLRIIRTERGVGCVLALHAGWL